MNILKCFLSFVLLLLYVEFNSATDCDVINKCSKIINNEQETEITALKSKLSEHQLAKDTLLRDKNKDGADSIEQNGIIPAEATSCLAFGNSNDIQTIRVPGAEAFQVPCDSKFAGEGWTVIQRRMDGSVSFNQNWDEYRNGFGDLRGEFWLGLEKLYLMIKFQPHELYVELEDFKSEKQYARYSNFTIANEAQYYELLSVGKYTGNAGNALDSGMYGMTEKNSKFLTPDRNNDSIHECAAAMVSGWWFNGCYRFNLNGVYSYNKTYVFHDQSIIWDKYHYRPLKFVQMMIRPSNN